MYGAADQWNGVGIFFDSFDNDGKVIAHEYNLNNCILIQILFLNVFVKLLFKTYFLCNTHIYKNKMYMYLLYMYVKLLNLNIRVFLGKY